MQNLNFKAGEVITFTEGDYSDYTLIGTFVFLRSVTEEEIRALLNGLKEEKAAENAPFYKRKEELKAAEQPFLHVLDEMKYKSLTDVFLARLLRTGWIIEVNNREINVSELTYKA